MFHDLYELMAVTRLHRGGDVRFPVRTDAISALDRHLYDLCVFVRDSILLPVIFKELAVRVGAASGRPLESGRLLQDATLIHRELMIPVGPVLKAYQSLELAHKYARQLTMRYDPDDRQIHPYELVESEMRFGVQNAQIAHGKNCFGMNLVLKGWTGVVRVALMFDEERFAMRLLDGNSGDSLDVSFNQNVNSLQGRARFWTRAQPAN